LFYDQKVAEPAWVCPRSFQKERRRGRDLSRLPGGLLFSVQLRETQFNALAKENPWGRKKRRRKKSDVFQVHDAGAEAAIAAMSDIPAQPAESFAAL